MFKKLKKVFTYDHKKMRSQSDRYTRYLTKRKYKLMGVKKLLFQDDYGVVIDKKNNRYVVILTSLKRQNGTNHMIDKENYNANIDVLDSIQNCKVVLRAKHMDRLKQNIRYMENLIETQNDQEIKSDMEERLQYMKLLNMRGEMLCYYYILEKDLNEALAKMSVLFDCKVLNNEELENYLFDLHNERGVL